MNEDVCLSVKGLCKKYGDLKAADDVTFSVNRGEVFGLLGPNGAGKTTVIRMLCGLLKADAGDMVLDGVSISSGHEDIKHLIGLCPQDIVVWELLTCHEQLKYTGMFYGLSPQEALKRAEELLGSLGLQEKRGKLAKTLSGGMQRRLNIALALIHDPELVILDEPQAGLDPQGRILVRDFIRRIAREKTVILTTHDMDEADRLSDRVGIIDHGRLLLIDTPEKIKEKAGQGDVLQIRVRDGERGLIDKALASMAEVTERNYADGCLFLGAEGLLELVPKVRNLLEAEGVAVEDMTLRKRTLEDAFIAMTGRGLRE